MVTKNILESGTNLEDRLFSDLEELKTTIEDLKRFGYKIVLTSGSWDLFHDGHAEYLERAKEQGDILVVGVDSDAKVRKRKGKGRPVVDEDERVRVLSHIRHIGIIFVKQVDDEEHGLIKAVHPDVLIVSESTKHRDEKIEAMKSFCERVEILPPQSETSTTAKIRLLHVNAQRDLLEEMQERVNQNPD